MTPEQLRAYLATNPAQSFAALGANALDLMRDQLRSGPSGFTPQQRAWLAGFYLVLPSQATRPEQLGCNRGIRLLFAR